MAEKTIHTKHILFRDRNGNLRCTGCNYVKISRTTKQPIQREDLVVTI